MEEGFPGIFEKRLEITPINDQANIRCMIQNLKTLHFALISILSRVTIGCVIGEVSRKKALQQRSTDFFETTSAMKSESSRSLLFYLLKKSILRDEDPFVLSLCHLFLLIKGITKRKAGFYRFF